MPNSSPKKSADLAPLTSQGHLVSTATFLVPTAFAPGAEGSRAAHASCTQALAAMTEFHLAAACEELFDWFTANEDVASLTLNLDFESDDEGRSWRSEHFRAQLKDGTDSTQMDSYYEGNGAELSDSPESLFELDKEFLYALLDQYPLARTTLMNNTLTLQSSKALIPSAFKAHQEALVIASVAHLGSNSTRTRSI